MDNSDRQEVGSTLPDRRSCGFTMSVEQQQQQQQQSSEPKQNAIAAAAGRFKEVLGNLLKEVRRCDVSAAKEVKSVDTLQMEL